MRKTYTGTMQLKEFSGGQPGEFRCEFATLNVIDHDGDVTRAGAFRDGQEVWIEPWNHNYGTPPVGKGLIREEGDKAICEGSFFLDTQNGKEHYIVVKAAGALQQWSYTFQIEESSQGRFEERDVRFLDRLDVWGVSPVTRGSGIDTRTTDIKGAADAESAPACPVCGKSGARHTSQEYEQIQQIHDLVVGLGAKCAAGDEDDADEPDEAAGDDGKSRGTPRSVLQAQIDIELQGVL